jgi:hypothetical protein
LIIEGYESNLYKNNYINADSNEDCISAGDFENDFEEKNK